MVKKIIVIQLIFADKFVSQGFTIRAAPGLSGPANTCELHLTVHYTAIKKTVNVCEEGRGSSIQAMWQQDLKLCSYCCAWLQICSLILYQYCFAVPGSHESSHNLERSSFRPHIRFCRGNGSAAAVQEESVQWMQSGQRYAMLNTIQKG